MAGFLWGQPEALGQESMGFGWLGHCEGRQAGPGDWAGQAGRGAGGGCSELSGQELPGAGSLHECECACVNIGVTSVRACVCKYRCVYACVRVSLCTCVHAHVFTPRGLLQECVHGVKRVSLLPAWPQAVGSLQGRAECPWKSHAARAPFPRQPVGAAGQRCPLRAFLPLPRRAPVFVGVGGAFS